MVVANNNKLLNIFEIFCGLQPYHVIDNRLKLSKWKSFVPVLVIIIYSIVLYNYWKNEEKFDLPSKILHNAQFYYFITQWLVLILFYFITFSNIKRLYILENEVKNIELELERIYPTLGRKEVVNVCEVYLKILLLNCILDIVFCGLYFESFLIYLESTLLTLIFEIPYTITECIYIGIISWYHNLYHKYSLLNCTLKYIVERNEPPRKFNQLIKRFKAISKVLENVNRLYNVLNLLTLMLNYFEILENGFLLLYYLLFNHNLPNFLQMFLFSSQAFLSAVFNITFLCQQANKLIREVSNENNINLLNC